MSASLLEFFKGGPPAPKVVLLPDTHFFVRSVPVPEVATPEDVAVQVELALEANAPFPIEHLNHGFYWVPGAAQALAFAAYRRRFTAEQVESWRGAELVMPTFAALFGMEAEPATTVILPGVDMLTAVGWADSPVPAKVLVRPLAPEATAEDRARVRDELLREMGGSKKIVDLAVAPTIAPSGDEKVFLFQAGETALRLSAAPAAWLDVRAKDELAALRKERARDMMLWRIVLSCAATLVLLAIGEFGLIGGRMWQKTRVAKVATQRPVVEKTMTLQTLTTRIEELSTKRLLPFEMITIIAAKKPAAIQFIRTTTVGLYQLEVDAVAMNPGEVPAYQAMLTENPAIAKVQVSDQKLQNNRSSFKLTVDFKPEALKPAVQP